MGLGTEFNRFILLAPDYRSEIWLVQGYYPVLQFRGRIGKQELLLGVYLLYHCQSCEVLKIKTCSPVAVKNFL